MFKKQDFAAKVMATFRDRALERSWYYIAFETERDIANKGGPIVFMGATILEAPTIFEAVREAYKRQIVPQESETRNEPVQIPEDKLPPAEYCNRL